jgi:hypothetical protein
MAFAGPRGHTRRESNVMTFTLTSLIMDAADPEEESSFWHRLLGGTLTRTPTHHFVRTDGLPVLVIQHSPGHVPPR